MTISPMVNMELFDYNLIENDNLIGFKRIDINEYNSEPIPIKYSFQKEKYKFIFYH